MYHEPGGVNASSRGMVGSKESTVHCSGRAPEKVAETPEIRKECRRERRGLKGEINGVRYRVRVLEEGRYAMLCAIAMEENWSMLISRVM